MKPRRTRPEKPPSRAKKGLTGRLLVVVFAISAAILLLILAAFGAWTSYEHRLQGIRDTIAKVHQQSSSTTRFGIEARESIAVKFSDIAAEQRQEHKVTSSSTSDKTSTTSIFSSNSDSSLIDDCRNFFSDILLVLSFESPELAWKGLDFWRVLYGRAFPHILVLSTYDIPQLGVRKGPNDKHASFPSAAAFTYDALPAVLQEQSGSIRGLLWVQADALIVFWRLLQLDRSKAWFLPLGHPNVTHVSLTQHAGSQSEGGSDSERQEVDAGLPDPSVLSAVASVYEALPSDFHKRLDQSVLPLHHVAVISPASAFFVPWKLFGPLSQALVLYSEANVPAQIAIPMSLRSIAEPNDVDLGSFKDARLDSKNLDDALSGSAHLYCCIDTSNADTRHRVAQQVEQSILEFASSRHQ